MVILFQIAVHVRAGEHIIAAHVTLIRLHRAADQEIPALERRHLPGGCPGQAAQRLRHAVGVMIEVHSGQIHRIPAEELVGSLAGEHHLHILRRVLRQKIERDLRRVRHGIVKIILDDGGGVKEIIRADLVADVRQAHGLAEILRIRQLAVFFLLIAHGERLDSVRRLADFLHHIAGIHAGGEEAAHLDVGNLVREYAFGERFGDASFPFFQRRLFVDVIADLVIPADGELSVLILKITAVEQLEHMSEHRLLVRNVLIAEVFREPFLVDFLYKVRVGQETLDFRAEEKVAVVLIVIERLDAENIARAEQLLCGAVPDDEGIHAAQPLQHAGAPLLIAVQQHFAVRGGLERVTGVDQLAAQVLKVINLTVEGEHLRAVLIEDRLAAALQINDAQPAETHSDVRVNIIVVLVRSAVADAVRHVADDGLTIAAPAVRKKSCKSTQG